MYINDLPKPQEIRYWTFVDFKGRPSLFKVKVLSRRYDKRNDNYVVKVENIESVVGATEVYKIDIDFWWQLQKTLEDAKKVMMIGIFKPDAFYRRNPPWLGAI